MDARTHPFLTEMQAHAPNLFSWLADRNSGDQARYVMAQILALQVHGHVEPVECYGAFESPGKPVLDRRNSTMACFAAPGARLANVTLFGKSQGQIWFGSDAQVRNLLVNSESSFATIVIGPNTEITDCVLQFSSGRTALVISSGTTIPNGNFLVSEDWNHIVVGDDCMLSSGIAARTSDSHSIFDTVTRTRINFGRPILLHRHVWVGRSVIMNKGTVVGPDAVIGQGAITSGSLTGGTIHAGHPAKPLRENVTWDRTSAATLDEAEVIQPSRKRQWNHIRTCQRIDGYGSQPFDGLPLLHVLSRLLAATADDARVMDLLSALKTANALDDLIRCAEAHKLRLASVGRPIPPWLEDAARPKTLPLPCG